MQIAIAKQAIIMFCDLDMKIFLGIYSVHVYAIQNEQFQKSFIPERLKSLRDFSFSLYMYNKTIIFIGAAP